MSMRSRVIRTANYIPLMGTRRNLCDGSGWKYIRIKLLNIGRAPGKLPAVGNGTAGLQLRSCFPLCSRSVSNWVHRAFPGGVLLFRQIAEENIRIIHK